MTRAAIINVGKGLAKDIKVEFEFERDNFEKEFKDKDIKAAIREEPTSIDYVLALEMNGFNLPVAYTTVLLSHLNFGASSIIEKYPLYVKITFKDFYDEKLCVKYRVHITDLMNDYSFYVQFERLDDTNDCKG
jgi:hypothetical protein